MTGLHARGSPCAGSWSQQPVARPLARAVPRGCLARLPGRCQVNPGATRDAYCMATMPEPQGMRRTTRPDTVICCPWN